MDLRTDFIELIDELADVVIGVLHVNASDVHQADGIVIAIGVRQLAQRFHSPQSFVGTQTVLQHEQLRLRQFATDSIGRNRLNIRANPIELLCSLRRGFSGFAQRLQLLDDRVVMR